MAIQFVNVGAAPNDGTGDLLRDGFIKINSNFGEIQVSLGAITDIEADIVALQLEVADKAEDDNVIHATGLTPEFKEGPITFEDNVFLPNIVTDVTPTVALVGIGTVSRRLVQLPPDENLEVIVLNRSGEIIPKGSVVYIDGAQGNRPTIALAKADANIATSLAIGITEDDINNNAEGRVVTSGIIERLNVPPATFTEGDKLFLSADTLGAITNVPPVSPNNVIFLGTVVAAHNTLGRILVSVAYTFKLDRLVDVAITAPTTGQTIVYDDATKLWKNQTPSGGGTTPNLQAVLNVSGSAVDKSIDLSETATGKYISVAYDGVIEFGVSGGNYIELNLAHAMWTNGSTASNELQWDKTTPGFAVYRYPEKPTGTYVLPTSVNNIIPDAAGNITIPVSDATNAGLISPSVIPITPGYKTTDGTDEEVLLAGGGKTSFTNVVAGGQTEVFQWKFETNIAATDPGNGNFRANSATPASITQLYVDDLTSGIVADISAMFARVKGDWFIHIQQTNNAANYIQFTTNQPFIDNTGWWTLPVTYVNSSGFPFVNTTACTFVFVNNNGSGSTKRVTLFASAATVTPNASTDDIFKVNDSYLTNTTVLFAQPSGTKVNGQMLMIMVKDNNTARGLTWALGTSGDYTGTTDFALPSTTILGKWMRLLFQWNADPAVLRWELIGIVNS